MYVHLYYQIKPIRNMTNSKLNPAMVASYEEGKKLAHDFFKSMNDDRHIYIRNSSYSNYECYTDSGSDDYYYFTIDRLTDED